ncbi:MAG TPA: PQQ-dependent sugar dehydrogenase, partial [Chitinophagaceae bacterium]|nr:PQQ-dependent sugar dehydrogenase [Chitinophagaceae bacterium]
RQATALNVYWKTDVPGVNAEEGIMGLQADPDFAKNHYIYVYYSPKDTSVNRLSRFKFENDTIDVKSEKIILQLYSQRQICCHTGGSIAFGTGRTMFLSTGDNSTPFDEPKQKYVNHGFGPLDDRPGHEQYDARRSSANTNDLRGKILRIVVNEDGTYNVPEGNLFAKGQDKTRPEIYVMGNRNPYRISVDKKTGFLYWGEVGPDAGSDSLDTRGPKGYDELNQARNAGYFGWPLFVGNNYPYRQYDYASGKSGAAYDPQKPVNNSRNNTGITDLPAVQPAFIWYPYDNSKEFPQLGNGSRNAMAGPAYYVDAYPKETRLPDYYDKKLFIYDWMRNWIKVVTMLPNGDFDKMEPFMGSTKFHNSIDMEVGPDGKIYVLEYGTGWFSKNADAGLSRLDYNGGNRAPKVGELTVDKTSGGLPFTVTARVDAKDPEKDPLKYTWHLGDVTKETTEPSLQYTFDKAGDYAISVDVSDGKAAASKSNLQNVYAGNEAPTVAIKVKGNQSFYFPGRPVQYEVTIKDADDTAAMKDMNDLFVSADYNEGSDKAASMGHQILTEAMIGKNIMNSLDCKTCQKKKKKSIGPSYTDVAKKYEKDPNAMNYLSQKIIKGGGGVWGEVAMAAHPTLKESDARQIVAWIQTLAGQAQKRKSLPPVGSVAPSDKPTTANTALFITATYTDKGRTNIKPLTGTSTLVLRNSKLGFGSVKQMEKFQPYDVNGSKIMVTPTTPGWFAIDSIDLSRVTNVAISVGWQKAPEFGFTYELHLDSQDGQLLGKFDLKGAPPSPSANPNLQQRPSFISLNSSFTPVTDGKLHKLYITSKPRDPKESTPAGLQWIEFR